MPDPNPNDFLKGGCGVIGMIILAPLLVALLFGAAGAGGGGILGVLVVLVIIGAVFFGDSK